MKPASETQTHDLASKWQDRIRNFSGIKGYFLGDKKLVDFVRYHPGNGSDGQIQQKIASICHEEWMLCGTIYHLSSHIKSLPMHNALHRGDLDIVSQIAQGISPANQRHYYDFASLYCAIHNPNEFPIWSPHALSVISSYSFKETENSFSSYIDFALATVAFKQHFGLEGLNYMEINIFFWLYEDAVINGF